jgi:hypothetical protein
MLRTVRIPALLLVAIAALVCVGDAVGSRNSSGSYSLPSGNPVVTGTSISSSWANNTLGDIGTELTNSLDRSGRGAMLAPLQLSSGTVTSPGLTFSAETGTGLYRIGASDVALSVNQTKRQEWTSAGSSVVGTLGVSGATTLSSTLAVTGGSTLTGNTTVGGTLGVTGATTATGGLTIGSGGAGVTAISKSLGATYVYNAGLIAAGTCYVQTPTLAGATVGGVCHASSDADLGGGGHVAIWTDCAVTAADTITLRVCNGSASGFTSGGGNYRVRVFQP